MKACDKEGKCFWEAVWQMVKEEIVTSVTPLLCNSRQESESESLCASESSSIKWGNSSTQLTMVFWRLNELMYIKHLKLCQAYKHNVDGFFVWLVFCFLFYNPKQYESKNKPWRTGGISSILTSSLFFFNTKHWAPELVVRDLRQVRHCMQPKVCCGFIKKYYTYDNTWCHFFLMVMTMGL